MTNVKENLKDFWPYKFTLSEIQAASGHLMLKRVDKLNIKRIERAKKFKEIKENTNCINFVEYFGQKRHVYHLLTGYVKKNKIKSRQSNRDAFKNLI